MPINPVASDPNYQKGYYQGFLDCSTSQPPQQKRIEPTDRNVGIQNQSNYAWGYAAGWAACQQGRGRANWQPDPRGTPDARNVHGGVRPKVAAGPFGDPRFHGPYPVDPRAQGTHPGYVVETPFVQPPGYVMETPHVQYPFGHGRKHASGNAYTDGAHAVAVGRRHASGNIFTDGSHAVGVGPAGRYAPPRLLRNVPPYALHTAGITPQSIVGVHRSATGRMF